MFCDETWSVTLFVLSVWVLVAALFVRYETEDFDIHNAEDQTLLFIGLAWPFCVWGLLLVLADC